ncbi:hypothetical protein [Viscerimonas tarda]
MNTTKIELNENRDFGGRINALISFIKQNGKAIAKGLLYLIPVYIILGIFSGLTTQLTAPSYSVTNLLLTLATSLASIAAAVFVISYVAEYDESEDGTVDSSRVWDRAKSSYLGALGAGFLVGLAMILGFMFCIIPGIWLAISFCVYLPAYVADRRSEIPCSAVDSIRESYNLVKQDWFGTFAFVFIISIIFAVCIMVIAIPLFIVQMTIGLSPTGSSTMLTALAPITTAAYNVAALFFSSVFYIASAFLYYDLKERRDNTSLQRKIDSIGE